MFLYQQKRSSRGRRKFQFDGIEIIRSALVRDGDMFLYQQKQSSRVVELPFPNIYVKISTQQLPILLKYKCP